VVRNPVIRKMKSLRYNLERIAEEMCLILRAIRSRRLEDLKV